MGKKVKAKFGPPPEPKPVVPNHTHPLPEHDHPLPEHTHPLPDHGHPLLDHEHPLPDHTHPLPEHNHPDLRGHLRGSVRGLLAVIEAGSVNTEQRKAIHAVRVIIGDAYGTVCSHELCVYEEGNRLICQDCREDVTPETGG